MITIEMLAALYGDTLLIDISPDDAPPFTILIDCGFNYRKGILPVLERYAGAGRVIDRFIITHYDADHINSAETFIKGNGTFKTPGIIPVSQVWLNAYRHLQFSKTGRQVANESDLKRLKKFIRDHTVADPDEGKISAAQASLLGKTLLEQGYPWNLDAGGQAVCVENIPSPFIHNGVHITLLSPTIEKLTALEKKFEEALEKKNIPMSNSEFMDDALELFIQNIDKTEPDDLDGEISSGGTISLKGIQRMTRDTEYLPDNAPGNGSSIAFILEADGKRLLLLADAHAEVVVEQLEKLYPDAGGTIYFDVVKVSHHGSFRNNSPRLLSMIDSPLWLISTNGEHPSHDHPDAATIAHMINRKLTHDIEKRKIIFNYELPHMKGFFDLALMKEYHYEAVIANTIPIP